MLTVSQYFGGKSNLVPLIVPILEAQPHRTYSEPFGGLFSVGINKEPVKNEFYNDSDNRVHNLLTVIRDQPKNLIQKLSQTPYSRTEFNKCKPQHPDPIEDARCVFVLLTQGGNGRLSDPYWHRVSHKDKRQGNRPKYFGSKIDDLLQISNRLTSVYLENTDALELMVYLDSPDALQFLDPPYLPEKRTSARYKNDMTRGKHQEMINILPSLESKICLCGYDNEMYNDSLEGWYKMVKEVNARGNVKEGEATKRSEVMWFNFDPFPKVDDLPLFANINNS